MKQTKFFIVVICVLILLLVSIRNTFSQGSWDLDYLTINSLNNSFIGKEIRLDFKSDDTDTLNSVIDVLLIRKLLVKEDTITLIIEGKPYVVKENWKVYVDHGNLQDQTLEGVAKGAKHRIAIKSMFLTSVTDSIITVKAKVYASDTGKRSDKVKQAKECQIMVGKSDIKGLLIDLE